MECSLAKTKPNPMRILTSGNTWDNKATEAFEALLQEQIPVEGGMPAVYAEIYSVISRPGKNGPLLSVILFPTNNLGEQSFLDTTRIDERGSIVSEWRFEESLNYRLQQ